MIEIFDERKLVKSIENLRELDSLLQQKSLEQFQCIKIEISNEKFNILKELKQKLQETGSVKELYLNLNKTGLNNTFISDLILCLNDLTSLQSVIIKINDNSLSLKQSKRFILYIQKKFFPSSDIECTYQNKQLEYRCDRTSITFNYDLNKSFFIKDGLTKKMKIIIPRDYPEFYAFIKQGIEQEIENLQVIINYRNKIFAKCQSNTNYSLLLDIYTEDKMQIVDYVYNQHDVVHFMLDKKTQKIFDKININKQINFKFSHCLYNEEIFVFKNKSLTKNQITFIQQEIRDNKRSEKYFKFEDSFQVEILLQILPVLLIKDGELIQKRIKFSLKYKNNFDDSYAYFYLTEGETNNKKYMGFQFNNFDGMIQSFNAIFRILQQYQLVLYKLILYTKTSKKDKNRRSYFLENMIDKSIQYHIKIFKIYQCYQSIDKQDFIMPLIEELQSLEEMEIFTDNKTRLYQILDQNLCYLQKNKSKNKIHLIINITDNYNQHYESNLIKNKQYKLMNVNNITTDSKLISVLDFAKSKYLVQFQLQRNNKNKIYLFSPEGSDCSDCQDYSNQLKYFDDDYYDYKLGTYYPYAEGKYERKMHYNNGVSYIYNEEYFYHDVFNYKDITYFYY